MASGASHMSARLDSAVFLHAPVRMTSPSLAPSDSAIASTFPGDGEVAGLARAIDWSATSLGPVESWPDALRLTVRTALESPFPINLWCGPDLLLIYNDAYRCVLGAKHPRALGQPGHKVWSEIWSDIAAMFESIRSGGPPAYAEDAKFVMERTHGPPGEAWFTFALSPVRDDQGEIVAFLNIATETTQRLRAEREAQHAQAVAERAEQQLRDVFAQAPAFLAVLRGPEHRFEFVNAAYRRLVGDRDVVGMCVEDALPEVRGQGFIEILDHVLRTGEPFSGREIPVKLQQKSGEVEERIVDFVYQAISDADSSRSGIVAHGVDVTDQVRARQRVEESEARYRFLANAIPVQVWTASPDGALDYVSDRAAAYFGKTTEAVIGEQWLSVLHPDDVKRTLDRWAESLRTGAPYEVEFRLFSAAAQEYRWHLARATAQRDEQGQIIRWVGTNTEIEDRKRVEAELRRLTDEATEANRAKSAFLASMSHELRTPLNAIGGYAQLIELGIRGPVTDQQREDLLKIQRSKNHLDALVSDILNFAKLSAGKVEYHIVSVGVARLVSAVTDMVAPQLREKQLTLDVALIPPELGIDADEDKVRQILINLLGNALKFTPPGGRIAVTATDTPLGVTITVTDTGIGIPVEQLESIFEPFVQSKRALNAADQGVGLGLAISRQFARAMRGDLRASSEPGRGAAFTLTLPRA
jgi:PAS domain S-box-containing protein